MGKKKYGDLTFDDGQQEGKLVDQVKSGTKEAMNAFLKRAAFDRTIENPVIINTEVVYLMGEDNPSTIVVIRYQRRVFNESKKGV